MIDNGFIDQLACPLCGGSLEDGNMGLRCYSCGRFYAVLHDIPRLVPPDLPAELRKTSSAFGWQWRHFVTMYDQYEEQFLDWIHPVAADAFLDKDVLDAGCGIGRHAFFAARNGARSVAALDLSAAVDTARETLAELPNAHVVQGDILSPPFQRPENGGGFDIIYSIGVLHHLPNPRDGFLSLRRFLRPGGLLVVWVYGYENNGLVRNVVEPLRRVTTRIPPTLLRGIALPLAAVFHGAVKAIYRPAHGTALARRLPLEEYISSLSGFTFQQNYNIVFDQLVAPTAAYIRGDELREWFEAAGLEDVAVTSRHGNSWRGRGRAPEENASRRES